MPGLLRYLSLGGPRTIITSSRASRGDTNIKTPLVTSASNLAEGITTMQTQEVTRTATIWLDADGILRIITFPGVEDTIEDAKNNVATCARFTGDKQRPMLVDMRTLKAQSREVRAYYTGPESQKIICAAAVLVDSPISSIIGNFFLGFNKMDLPTKLFRSEDEALTWLKGFLL